MTRYRKITLPVEAVQWTGNNLLEIISFMNHIPEQTKDGALRVWGRLCRSGDYIQRFGLGFKVHKKSYFECHYERIT